MVSLLLSLAASNAFAEKAKPACTPIPGAEKLFKQGSVLLLGELHGTRESPAFAGNLVCNALAAKRDVVLGLELSGSGQEAVNVYLGSAGSEADRKQLLGPPMWQSSYQDGRNSRAMVKLIERVRQFKQQGSSARIVFFDAPGGQGGQQRERDMAANLLKSIESAPKSVHVVLTGNRHSRVFKGSRRNPEYEPMGYVLRQKLGDKQVTSLDVGYTGGAAWICSTRCGIVDLGASIDGDRPRGSIETDEKTRPSGHSGWYFVGAINASPPANGDFCRNEWEALQPALAWDYDAFDQSMEKGWRKLAKSQCQLEAARLIEQYLEQHENLEPYQKRILNFHAGQMLAFEDEYEAAIPHIERSLDEREEDDATFKWNAYVRATVAFLRGDSKELRRQREIVAQGQPRGGMVPNLNVVDAFVEHAGESYRVAYSSPAQSRSKPKEPPASMADAPLPPTASTEKWQGQWQAWEYGSKAWTIRFEDRNFYAVLGKDDWYHGVIALRPETSPPEVDFIIEDCRCNYKGKTSEAIFSWDGEAIKLATPQPGSPRPKVFNENNGQMVILKRAEK